MDFATWLSTIPNAALGPVSVRDSVRGGKEIVIDRGDNGQIIIPIPPFVTGVPAGGAPQPEPQPEPQQEPQQDSGVSVVWIGLLALAVLALARRR